MKKIRYGVAMSLDGFIAGPNGEYDWIIADPDINFAEIWAQFDTVLMGRRTYEVATARLGDLSRKGPRVVVVSRTLQPSKNVIVISDLNREAVEALREQSEKDIWLMGGGELFRSMLQLGEVDGIEVIVMPVMLGGGVAILPPLAHQTKLHLSSHRIYKSGIVSLNYEVKN